VIFSRSPNDRCFRIWQLPTPPDYDRKRAEGRSVFRNRDYLIRTRFVDERLRLAAYPLMLTLSAFWREHQSPERGPDRFRFRKDGMFDLFHRGLVRTGCDYCRWILRSFCHGWYRCDER
jgi:hypothetical protein